MKQLKEKTKRLKNLRKIPENEDNNYIALSASNMEQNTGHGYMEKKKNIKNIGLYSENNEKTLNFYKKQGFQVGKKRRKQ